MNTSFISNMKNIFFHSGNKSFRQGISVITPRFIYLTTVVFVVLFSVGCNGNKSTGESKKTDTEYVQPGNQDGEGMDRNHGGMGDDRRGMDSSHRGMDSMNNRRH